MDSAGNAEQPAPAPQQPVACAMCARFLVGLPARVPLGPGLPGQKPGPKPASIRHAKHSKARGSTEGVSQATGHLWAFPKAQGAEGKGQFNNLAQQACD